MLPLLREGDLLVVVHGAAAAPGDVVVAQLPDRTVALKRVEDVDGHGWWLASDNVAEGWSSRAWGQPIAAEQILAVARFRVWPRPRLLGRGNSSTP